MRDGYEHILTENILFQRKTLEFFDPNETFYGVQFLNERVKLLMIFNQLFQSAEETLFYSN